MGTKIFVFILFLLCQQAYAAPTKDCRINFFIGDYSFNMKLKNKTLTQLGEKCDFDRNLLHFDTKVVTSGQDRCSLKNITYAGQKLPHMGLRRRVGKIIGGTLLIGAAATNIVVPAVFAGEAFFAILAPTAMMGGALASPAIMLFRSLKDKKFDDNWERPMERRLLKTFGEENCNYEFLMNHMVERVEGDEKEPYILGFAYNSTKNTRDNRDFMAALAKFNQRHNRVCQKSSDRFNYKNMSNLFGPDMDPTLDPRMDDLVGKWQQQGRFVKDSAISFYHAQGITTAPASFGMSCRIAKEPIQAFEINKVEFRRQFDPQVYTKYVVGQTTDDYEVTEPDDYPIWAGVQTPYGVCRYLDWDKDQLVCANSRDYIGESKEYNLFKKIQ